MENQHQKIKGYRDLSQTEIDLMNKIKEKEQETLELHQELHALRTSTVHASDLTPTQKEESLRCLEIAKEKLQTGYMWFVRAVALPNVK